MARKYDPEVVVRIWRNIRRRGLPTAHVGHAAVTVRGSSFLGDDPYISWWPDWPDDMPEDWRGKFWSVKEVDGFASPNYRIDKLGEIGDRAASRLELRFQFATAYSDMYGVMPGRGPGFTPLQNAQGKQLQKRYEADPSKMQGATGWGRSADAKINIPGTWNHHRGIAWGLATNEIAVWWNQAKSKLRYRMISRTQNCASVALRALYAGGARAYVPAPRVVAFTEPVQVEAYAEKVKARVHDLNRKTAAMHTEGLRISRRGQALPVLPVDDTDDLCPTDHWKTTVAGQGAGSLPLTVGDLARCHTASDTQNAETRLAALILLQEHLWTFYQGNRQSPVLPSVLALASQVRDVLNNDMVFA